MISIAIIAVMISPHDVLRMKSKAIRSTRSMMDWHLSGARVLKHSSSEVSIHYESQEDRSRRIDEVRSKSAMEIYL